MSDKRELKITVRLEVGRMTVDQRAETASRLLKGLVHSTLSEVIGDVAFTIIGREVKIQSIEVG